MRRSAPSFLLAAALLAAPGCTATDLATLAQVAAEAPGASPGPGAVPGGLPGASPGPGSVPGRLPGASPRPSGSPAGKPSAPPAGQPGGAPGGTPGTPPGGIPGVSPTPAPAVAGQPGSSQAPGVFRWQPKWAAKDYPGEPAVEALVLKYTNEERVTAGLAPLDASPLLDVAARQHSREMIELDYFAHQSPVAAHAGVADRMRLAGYLGIGGENIFDMFELADAEKLAHELVDGWMNSPGHRANILRDSYVDLGVGIHRGGDRVMATQVFGSGLDFAPLEVTLEDVGTAYRLRASGTAGKRTVYRSFRVTVDGEPVGEAIDFEPGAPLTLAADLPKGGTHEFGIDRYDPADGGRQFWPSRLFTVDTAQGLAEAIQ